MKTPVKTRLLTALCVVGIAALGIQPTMAQDRDSTSVIADILVVRPACFVATVLGTAFFVASLPIAATSRSVKRTGRILVMNPARATFTRELGDFTAIED